MYNNGNVNHPAGSAIQQCQSISWLCHTTMSINQLALPYNNVNQPADSAIQQSISQLTLPYNNGNVSHPAGSAIQCTSKGQLSSLIPIRIQGFDVQKLEKIKKFAFKTTIYLSLDLNKGRPSYRKSLQPSKENIQHFKT
jgi:hypothetical protein